MVVPIVLLFVIAVWGAECSLSLPARSSLHSIRKEGKSEHSSVYAISEAFLNCQGQADQVFAQMQQRINKGKILTSFGSRVDKLMESSIRNFHSSISGSRFVVERSLKARDLQDYLLRCTKEQFDQQVLLLQQGSRETLRRRLAECFNKDSGLFDDSSARKALLIVSAEYVSSLRSLQCERWGIVLEDSDSFSSQLTKDVADFPSSAAHQLHSLRKVNTMKVQQSGVRSASSWPKVKVATSIVGMLRPPGYGNLQGFVGYRSSVLGFPLDFLLGVQNDGESLDIIEIDREQPFLRIQPKFHVDVNL